MDMENKALICALKVLINSQHASNMHGNKQQVNSENKVLICLTRISTNFHLYVSFL